MRNLISTTLLLFCSTANCIEVLIPGFEDNPGVKLFNESNYEQAEQYFDSHLSNGGKLAELSLVYLAKYAILKNNGKEAVKYIEESLKIEPNNVQELMLAAEAYCTKAMQVSIFNALKLGRRCGKYYDLAANQQPPYPRALKNAVLFHWEAPSMAGGSRESALRYLDQLSKLSEEDSRILKIFQKENESGEKEAISLANKYASMDYTSDENLYDLAIYFRDKGHSTKAIELFRKITDSVEPVQPNWHYYDAVFQLGEQLINTEIDVEQGISLIEKYITSSNNIYDPHFFWSRWRLARAYQHIGNTTKYHEIVESIEQQDYSHNEDFAKEFNSRDN